MRDRSFGKRQKITSSPDHKHKGAIDGSKSSIYDKVRRKVDDIVKQKEEPRLFRRSPDRYQSAKLFEKKHNPLVEQSYNEEESREFNVVKDQIPKIEEKQAVVKEIFINRIRIPPYEEHKAISNASTVKNPLTFDSSLSGSEYKDFREKMLSIPNDSRDNSGYVGRYANRPETTTHYEIQTTGIYRRKIQHVYEKLFKSKGKPKLSTNYTKPILLRNKPRLNISISSNYTYVQQRAPRSSTKTISNNSQNDTDEMNELKENKLRAKNEMKFLSMNIEQLKKEISDLQDELRVHKFDRDNAITNFNQASKKIQEQNAHIEGLQRKLQKTSSQFGEIIDYLYRLNNQKYIEQLESIIGTDDRKLMEETHWKIGLLHKKLAEVMEAVSASKDKKLLERVNAVVKR